MINQSRLTRILFTPLMFWIALFGIGCYLIVSVDSRILRQPMETSGFYPKVQRAFHSISLSRIKKGIDLAGGVYLVLSVELEKAIENRLGAESRSLDHLFKTKDFNKFPKSKDVKGLAIEMLFDDEEVAKSCFNFIREKRGQVLKTKRTGTSFLNPSGVILESTYAARQPASTCKACFFMK